MHFEHQKIVIIYNPKAGSLQGNTDKIRQLEAALVKHGARAENIELCATGGSGDATRLAAHAAAAKHSVVIACGGDGTINEVAQGLVGTATALAVLPLGTANVMAKELRLSRDPAVVARQVIKGETRTIAVGKASKQDGSWHRYFLLMAGIGLDAAIIETVDPTLKKRWGIGAYVVAGLKALFDWRLQTFSLQFGHEKVNATFAIIANAANYAAWFKIAPASDMQSDTLNLCAFRSYSRVVYLGYAFLSLFGAHTMSPNVLYEPITAVYANTSPHTPVQLDGELVGVLPMNFECVPQALQLII